MYFVNFIKCFYVIDKLNFRYIVDEVVKEKYLKFKGKRIMKLLR